MSRLVGPAVGAAGATVYLKPELVQDWAKDLVFGPSSRSGSSAAPGKELEHLQRLVSHAAAAAAALPLPARAHGCCRQGSSASPHACCCELATMPWPAHRWRTCRGRWRPAGRAA